MMYEFEKKLAEFCGSPFAVSVDSCTHAIELSMRYLRVTECEFTAYTYLSVPQTLNLLGVRYKMTDEKWHGEYRFHKTNIWDSARCLKPNMYRQGQFQCLSFGPGKPVDNVRGGAILCDDPYDYRMLKRMSYDGRDPDVALWIDQKEYTQGFHYMMRWEEEETALSKLDDYIEKAVYEQNYKPYHDCRKVTFR